MEFYQDPPSIVCPLCGCRSYSPYDALYGYCGCCHRFTGGTVDNPEPVYVVEVGDETRASG